VCQWSASSGHGTSAAASARHSHGVVKVDVRQSQDEADGIPFGHLGVRICGAEVWSTGHGTQSRYLGPLEGARAGVTEPRRSRIGMFISRVLLGGRV
jgi:hypothetical protein